MIGERRAARSVRSLLEIQKCTSIEKSQCLCGFPLLSGCTSMPRSCTLPLILVHLYNNENPSVYAGLRHCCTLSYSKPWGPWPDWTSRLLAFRKGGSLRKSRVETSKSFVHLFKGGGVWGPLRPGGTLLSGRPSRQARPNPKTFRGCKGSWCPVGTVQDRSTLPLRSVLGVCHWQTAPEAAAETEAPAFPYSQKGGTYVPLLGWHRARGFCLWKGRAGCLRDRSSGYRLWRMRRLRCIFSTGCAG